MYSCADRLAMVLWVASWFLPRVLLEWAWKRRLRGDRLAVAPDHCRAHGQFPARGFRWSRPSRGSREQAPRADPRRIQNHGQSLCLRRRHGHHDAAMPRARLDWPNFNLFASALLVNREMGGDISETLTRISQVAGQTCSRCARPSKRTPPKAARTSKCCWFRRWRLLGMPEFHGRRHGRGNGVYDLPQGYGLAASGVAVADWPGDLFCPADYALGSVTMKFTTKTHEGMKWTRIDDRIGIGRDEIGFTVKRRCILKLCGGHASIWNGRVAAAAFARLRRLIPAWHAARPGSRAEAVNTSHAPGADNARSGGHVPIPRLPPHAAI